MSEVAVRHRRTRWQRFVRFCRRYREVIMITLALAMSLGFLAFGMWIAIYLESLHPQWFQNGF
jgi:hypothetical protein